MFKEPHHYYIESNNLNLKHVFSLAGVDLRRHVQQLRSRFTMEENILDTGACPSGRRRVALILVSTDLFRSGSFGMKWRKCVILDLC